MLWRSSFWLGRPAPQRKCAGLLSTTFKEVESVRQQEEQEDKRDEEIGDEVNGEVEEITHRAHETWVWRWVERRLKLEPQCACIYQKRQSKDNDTNLQQKRETKKNEGSSMHEKLTHWHQLRSHVPWVYQVISNIVGFRSVLRVVHCCRCNHLLNFDLNANSLLRFTLRKTFEVVFTSPCSSFNSPRFASFNLTWDAEAASNELCSTFIQLSGFPEDTDIPGLSDAIGIDAKVFWENHLKDLNRIPRFRNIGIREQMALRQLCPKLCTVVNVWTNSLFLPKQHWMTGSDSPFQDTTQTMNENMKLTCWWQWLILGTRSYGWSWNLWMIVEFIDSSWSRRALATRFCTIIEVPTRDKMTVSQTQIGKSELTPTSTSLVQNNNYERISNAIWTELGRENKRRVNLVQIESHPESCKRNVAMSWSLRLPTCHVQRSLCLTFALGQYKHAQQSPHGVFGDAPPWSRRLELSLFPARWVIAICRRATACWSHSARQWMCRIFTAPRLGPSQGLPWPPVTNPTWDSSTPAFDKHTTRPRKTPLLRSTSYGSSASSWPRR